VSRNAEIACLSCPSLKKKSVTPHTLRHTAAMSLMHHGVDLTVIALWLGHESSETTQIYLHADMQLKERALAHATASGVAPDTLQTSPPVARLPGGSLIMPTIGVTGNRDPPNRCVRACTTRHNRGVGIMR
jgi:hypothetical protein